ncbi:glycine-rich domain-containing protein, partial [Citrobacter freundii]|uniref:glycine-rich domain-containing protein n=1 Tax=Citrobacter freundii TaxID=546 RepID=UPI000B1AEDB2
LGLQFFKSSPSSVSSAFTSVFSPDENIRIVLANNRVWGVQDNDGNVIPLPLDRGGLGATSAEEGVKNLGLADSEGRVGRLINVRVITASGTYTPSAGTKSVVAEIQGGGGAGGGSLGSVPTQASAGTGGNAGAYILHRFTTPPSGITVTIGAGGMGVPGANGNPGGNTSFGSLTAPGGAGGIYYAPQTPPLFSFNNSSSVTPTGGNLVNKAGQRGDPATVTSPLYGGSGDGGESLLGGGGDGRGVVAVSSNGNTATGYGAGGGGATSGGGSGGNASGGNGAPGVVIVWEYA